MKSIRILTIAFFTAVLLLSACTAKSDNDASGDVTAVIMIPGRIDPGSETELSVKVVQGSKTVDDAEEVQFEIWKDNSSEDSELIVAKHDKDGKYSIHTTFSEDGLYYAQTHITASGVHIMPIKPFIIGTATNEQLNKLENDKQQNPTPNHNHHH